MTMVGTALKEGCEMALEDVSLCYLRLLILLINLPDALFDQALSRMPRNTLAVT